MTAQIGPPDSIIRPVHLLAPLLFDPDMAPLTNRPPDETPAGGSIVMRCLHRDVNDVAKLGLGNLHFSPDSAEMLAAAIADIFQVSKQAALIRLGTVQVVRAE
jgi:hypothetical protein